MWPMTALVAHSRQHIYCYLKSLCFVKSSKWTRRFQGDWYMGKNSLQSFKMKTALELCALLGTTKSDLIKGLTSMTSATAELRHLTLHGCRGGAHTGMVTPGRKSGWTQLRAIPKPLHSWTGCKRPGPTFMVSYEENQNSSQKAHHSSAFKSRQSNVSLSCHQLLFS